MINNYDDNLQRFEAEGALPLPTPSEEGYVENEGARIYYRTFGKGRPVVLLHGGLGHSGNWGYQVPSLLNTGCKVILFDSRGHGKSTRDNRPYSYELMARDLKIVLDTLEIEKAGLVGWSDGAVVALIFADLFPNLVSGVFYFGCNMAQGGTKEILEFGPALQACFSRHTIDYAKLSETPDSFNDFVEAVSTMQKTQPNYTKEDLERIKVPVIIVHSEFDEFIKQEHSQYLAQTIPNADFCLLKNVSHFAPLQRPEQFNKVLLDFLSTIY